MEVTPTGEGRTHHTGLLILLAALALISGISLPLAHGQLVLATVSVGENPVGIAYDSAAGEVFVANYFQNTVSVISDSTNTVVASVNVGSEPGGVAYDSARGELFVTNSNSSTVSIISDSTNAVVATVPVGNGPADMAYDSAKGEVFVANS